MAKHYIYVRATKEKPSPPIIYDDEGNFGETEETDKELTTNLGPGDTVVWVKKGDVEKIDKIDVNSGQDIFIVDPEPQDDGTWQATTVGDLQPGATCEYLINYTVDGQPYSQDPKIRLRPSIGQ
jgi:hypothetical protein